MFIAGRSPLDVARELFRRLAEQAHLMTAKEAAQIASLFCEVYSGQRAMPRKGSERHFDTLILGRRGDLHYLRIKGAPDPLTVFTGSEWLNGEVPLDDDPVASWDTDALVIEECP